MSEVQTKNQTKPVCSITKPENPARMLPGKAHSGKARASRSYQEALLVACDLLGALEYVAACDVSLE